MPRLTKDALPQATKITLIDRVSVALFSGICALVLGGLIWFGLSWKGLSIGPLSFSPVVCVAIGFAVLGFVLAENLVVNLIMGLWELLMGLAKL